VLAVLGLLASEALAQEAAPESPPAAAPATDATTPPTVPECMAWHASGQKLRYNSKLLESREPLRGCSHEACPELVRTDCTAWLLEVQQSLPSATFAATADGAPAQTLKVSVDGADVEPAVPLELDPGQHTLRFEIPGFAPVEKTVFLRNGDKNQVLSHAFVTPAAATGPAQADAPKTERPIHPLTWVLGGVSLASAGVATGFWLSARSDYDDLEQSCAPNCTEAETEDTKGKLLIADISLGVAVAAGVGALVVHLTRPEVRVAEDRGTQGMSLRFRASSQGGFISVGGSL
jgi:hypothetical protein